MPRIAKPVGKYLLVQRAKAQEGERTEGGLFLTAKTNAPVCRVIAIGPDVTVVKEKDEIVVSPNAQIATFSCVMPDVGLIKEDEILSRLEMTPELLVLKAKKILL